MISFAFMINEFNIKNIIKTYKKNIIFNAKNTQKFFFKNIKKYY